ncbi:hypothetical protein DY000_02008422 [Brassica cretica]|uniref:Uncharacterized protein n=1 Tax=Brassica cretica TaxID=69181 RepID=A0ABQ7BTW9_BRACR|nr:hypothetical protein DY000_02008422 [Brassica cretica]
MTDRSKKVNSIDIQKIDELTTKVDQLLKNNQGKSSSWKKLHRAIQKAAPETERQQRISRSETQEKIKALFTEALTLSLKVIIDKLDIMDVEPLQLTLVFVNSSTSVPYSSIRDLPVTDRSKKVNSIDTQKIDELTTKVDQLLKNKQGKSSSWKKLHRTIQKAAPETERQQRISRSETQEKIKALFTEALTLSLKVIIDKLDIMDVEPLQLTLVFVNSSTSVPYSSIRDLPG